MNLKTTEQEMRIDQQEWLILQVTLHIEKLMADKGVSKAELARRLGVNRAYITQLLDGQTNMTLKKIADVMLALDSSLVVSAAPVGFETTISPAMPEVSYPRESAWEPMTTEETTLQSKAFSQKRQVQLVA
jgi:transcriptional regulator with XRE-family HTH domain